MSAPLPAWLPPDPGPDRLDPTTGRRPDPALLPAASWQRWWQTSHGELAASEIGRLARAQGFAALTAQLWALGWQRHDLRRELRRGAMISVGHGVVSPVDVSDVDEYLVRRRRAALAATGAVLVRPGHVVSGRSAAVLHGLPTMAVPTSAEMTAPTQDTLGSRPGQHLYGAALSCEYIGSWFGADVTDPARTVVDLARHGRRDGLVAADAALRERLVTRADLDRALAGAIGWPGVRQARAVLALADPRAESPLESITRLALHDDGFPPVVPQVQIAGYWVDLLLPDHRLVIECDGRPKYVEDALAREKVREHRLGRLRFRVERVMWEDVVRLWPQTRLRLWSALYAP
jgi:very-short-patch-repair endonuclease